MIELVGMRYRPERFDYGWRYLHQDLPADLQRRLEGFACLASAAQIAGHLPAIDRLAMGLMDELAARHGGAIIQAAR